VITLWDNSQSAPGGHHYIDGPRAGFDSSVRILNASAWAAQTSPTVVLKTEAELITLFGNAAYADWPLVLDYEVGTNDEQPDRELMVQLIQTARRASPAGRLIGIYNEQMPLRDWDYRDTQNWGEHDANNQKFAPGLFGTADLPNPGPLDIADFVVVSGYLFYPLLNADDDLTVADAAQVTRAQTENYIKGMLEAASVYGMPINLYIWPSYHGGGGSADPEDPGYRWWKFQPIHHAARDDWQWFCRMIAQYHAQTGLPHMVTVWSADSFGGGWDAGEGDTVGMDDATLFSFLDILSRECRGGINRPDGTRYYEISSTAVADSTALPAVIRADAGLVAKFEAGGADLKAAMEDPLVVAAYGMPGTPNVVLRTGNRAIYEGSMVPDGVEVISGPLDLAGARAVSA